MEVSRADELMHPVRLRIVLALAGDRATARDIADRLPDIPQATLYRHLRKLVGADLLKVVEENPVRGAVEKVYAVASENMVIDKDDLARMSKEDHDRYFSTFMAMLLGQFRAYLVQDRIDLVADVVTYWTMPFNLSDAEAKELVVEIHERLKPRMAFKPTSERRRRTLSLVFIPEANRAVADAEESSAGE